MSKCECGCGEEALRGNRFVNGHNSRIKGRQRHSAATRSIISKSLTGRKLTSEHRATLVKAARRGPDNHQWKGDDVSNKGLHAWVKRHKERTGVCEHCGKKPKPIYQGTTFGTEFANVSGQYRRDVNDYIELCKPCHDKFDGRERK